MRDIKMCKNVAFCAEYSITKRKILAKGKDQSTTLVRTAHAERFERVFI